MTLGLIFHHFWLDCVFCVNSKGSHDSCSCDMLHYQKKICRYLLVLSSWMSLNFLFLFLWVIVSYPTILKIKLIINHKEILFELFASEIIIKKKQNEERIEKSSIGTNVSQITASQPQVKFSYLYDNNRFSTYMWQPCPRYWGYHSEQYSQQHLPSKSLHSSGGR